MFSCDSCELHKTNGGKFVQGLGKLQADVAIVFDAPSKFDARSGKPMSSENQDGTGDRQMLDKLLKRMDLTRDDVFITSLVNCRPALDDRERPEKPTDDQVEACFKHLDQELSFVKPKLIITMGALSAKTLTGARTLGGVAGRVIDSKDCPGLTWALSGETKDVTRKRVKVTLQFNKEGVYSVLPTYSVAMARRDPKYFETLDAVFDRGRQVLTGERPAKIEYDYRYAYSEQEVFDMLTEVRKRCDTEKRMFFDIETSGLNWYPCMAHDHVSDLLSCAWGFQEYQVYGTMLRKDIRSDRVMSLLRAILTHPIPKSGHNGKFDNVFLRGNLGIQVKNYYFDTMLAYWQLHQDSKSNGLGDLSPIYRPDLGYYWEEVEGKYLHKLYGYLNAPDDKLLEYNCRDVDATATLFNKFARELTKRNLVDCFKQITMPHQAALEDMEFHGVKLDVEKCKEIGRLKIREAEDKLVQIFQLTGRHPEKLTEAMLKERGLTMETYKPFNPGSGAQVAKILFGKKSEGGLGRKILVKTDKGAPSTSEAALQEHKDVDWVQAMLDYKHLKKQLSTYIGWERKEDGTEGVIKPKKNSAALLWLVDANGRIHTSFNVHGTATGRLSSSGPNLQNIPKTVEFRSLFVPEKGFKFGDSDYAALELRIVALLANDEALMQVFRDGVDPHSATGAKIFGLTMDDFEGKFDDGSPRKNRKERKVGKAINFGVVYGKGAKSLGDELGMTTEEAQQYLDGWMATYTGVASWIKGRIAELGRTGVSRYSIGRERPLKEIWSEDFGLANGAERQCINTPVQGTGADCTSMSVIRINKRLKEEIGHENARLVMEIHDQVVVEFKGGFEAQVKEIVVTEMQRQMPFLSAGIPLLADYEEVSDLGQGV